MLMPSVKPVHNWRNKKNKKRVYPIHLLINVNGVRKYYPVPLPQKVAEEQWSGEDDAWVKPSHPFFFEINNKVREKKNVVIELIKRYYIFNKSLSFPVIFQELTKKYNNGNFNRYFQDYIDNPTDKLEPDTFKKYKACLDHLNTFNKEIHFHDLSPELAEGFYQHCIKKAGLAGSTIDSYFNAFKKVVGLARKTHLISKDDAETLFEELHIDIKKAKRTYLTIEEIRLWRGPVCTGRRTFGA